MSSDRTVTLIAAEGFVRDVVPNVRTVPLAVRESVARAVFRDYGILASRVEFVRCVDVPGFEHGVHYRIDQVDVFAFALADAPGDHVVLMHDERDAERVLAILDDTAHRGGWSVSHHE